MEIRQGTKVKILTIVSQKKSNTDSLQKLDTSLGFKKNAKK
jgi:hypothetical protein